MKAINFFYIVPLLLFPSASMSETYKWTDEKGIMHFSDRPPPAVEKVPVPEKKIKKKVQKKTPPPLTLQRETKKKKPKLFDFREKVVDTVGVDVIVLESGKMVKYIGVQDPEEFLSGNGSLAKIAEAQDFHKRLVKGKRVTVLLGKTKLDRNGRYLGHVFLGQEAFINAELIRSGHAFTEENPGDFEYQSLFVRLLRNARDKGLGIWGMK